MIRPSSIAILASIVPCMQLAAAPAEAQSLTEVDIQVFKTVDLNGDGKISRREQLHFSDAAFLSMDHDGDEILTLDEISAWDLGYLQVAQQTGRVAALSAKPSRPAT